MSWLHADGTATKMNQDISRHDTDLIHKGYSGPHKVRIYTHNKKTANWPTKENIYTYIIYHYWKGFDANSMHHHHATEMDLCNMSLITYFSTVLQGITSIIIICYSIHVPGWLQKWLNLITAPGSVSNEPGSVTWLATKYLKTVSWRNHTEKLTTCWAQNISFWLKINIPSSYFTILMLNCLENTLKLQFDSYVTAVRFLT